MAITYLHFNVVFSIELYLMDVKFISISKIKLKYCYKIVSVGITLNFSPSLKKDKGLRYKNISNCQFFKFKDVFLRDRKMILIVKLVKKN